MWGKYGTRGMYVTHGARKPKDNKLKRETDLAQMVYEDRGDAQ